MTKRTYTSLGEANAARQKVWPGMSKKRIGMMLFRAVELGGEAGEALNVVKKLQRQRWGVRGSRATLEDLADELGDTIISAHLLAKDAGIDDLDRRVAIKFNKTSAKYGLPVLMKVPATRAEKAARTKRREARIRRKLRGRPNPLEVAWKAGEPERKRRHAEAKRLLA